MWTEAPREGCLPSDCPLSLDGHLSPGLQRASEDKWRTSWTLSSACQALPMDHFHSGVSCISHGWADPRTAAPDSLRTSHAPRLGPTPLRWPPVGLWSLQFGPPGCHRAAPSMPCCGHSTSGERISVQVTLMTGKAQGQGLLGELSTDAGPPAAAASLLPGPRLLRGSVSCPQPSFSPPVLCELRRRWPCTETAWD